MEKAGKRSTKFPGYYVFVGILGGLSWWLFESFMHHFIFPDDDPFITDLYVMEPNELWMRSITCALLLIIGVYAEIVAQRRARYEADLSESREMYRAFAESARDSVFIIDQSGTIQYVNGFGADFIGRTPELVTGRRIEELFPPDSSRRMRKNIDEVFSSGSAKVSTELFEVVGRKHWLDTSLAPIFGPEGGVVSVLGVSRDITRIKEYETHLRVERDRARLYLDVAGVMLMALDIFGRVSLINRKGVEILGYDNEEEIIGRDWFTDFLPEGIGAETRKLFDEIISGRLEHAEYYENEIVANDGTVRLVAWRNAVVRDAEGRITGTLSSGEDITEKRRTDNALAERLDELERFREVTVKRELRIKELKDKVSELESRLGEERERLVT